ncbi:MAG TPA: T9SS type A sorting domain-containing protein [Flavobacteriaceae bacterium]|nr:T9SS type A sorting domain-containing protein [Flavobacteriaceae bacterium]MCB9214104.1 T9SS type A sorting domain-containing protein [Alteromonas sp.]HPF11555.1 T9SS type A sorting domain-containing protein [Flavobacteriaceae bacterium]HQU21088.1 T9SS type A sorting domain-containing protein [Flavobacteriaceae bacterium]HQU65240.1 T9SS type A sorting domain-containing protein [Flavobacteriaceae bacterium]
MKKITLLAALCISAVSMAQIASTSFEEEVIEAGVNDGKYFDTGDANVAHDLVNNAGQTPVDQSGGTELGVDARYEPYDTPDVGLTDGDFVGVTNFTPSAEVLFTDGIQGYQISDTDGNYIMEFDPVDLTGASNPGVTLDYILSINGDGSNGNYEGDGTVNESGSDRLRIYIKDLTNTTEIDLFNSTGFDLDEFVPIDGGTGNYILQWQSASASLSPDTMVQLVVEARCNAAAEVFYLDNIVFTGNLGTERFQSNQFSIYPNPARDYVNITSVNSGEKQVQIFDVLGKQVMNQTVTNGLNISKLNSGIYLVKISQGNTSETKKLVVK